MSYTVIVAPEAVKDLLRLRAATRTAVRVAIARHLTHEPTKTSRTRIKRLRGVVRPQFRLRVGDVRVFYDVTEQEVQVLAVVAKQDADEWLREAGKIK